MDTAHLGYKDPQAVAHDTISLLLQRAVAQSMMLKRAFRFCASRRNDTELWRALEDAAAVLLERHRNGTLERQTQWLAQADRRLKFQVSELLRRMAPHSNRARQYRRAVAHLSLNAEGWSEVIGKTPAFYWRHSALVWMALWHMADMQSVTAEQAKKCLDHAFGIVSAPNPDAKGAARRWYRARGRFAAAFLWRA